MLRIITVGLFIALFCSIEIAGGNGISANRRRPNIIVLLADDLGYGELGCQGNPEIPTPNIDSIAAEGIRFTDGYVSAPYCSPSRAGILTGRYQTRFGYEVNPVGRLNEDPKIGIPASQVTLSEHLQKVGYSTALIGKWHLGGHANYHPLRHGFDYFFGFLHEGHYYVPPPYDGVTTMLRRRRLPHGGMGRWISDDLKRIYSTHMGNHEPAYDANNPIMRDGQPILETEYLTDAFTREAVDFIERNQAVPFFLFLSYNAVHSPLQGADRWMSRFHSIKDIQRRIFAAMLANLDESVGKVLDQLQALELERNTLVFFLSDNGGPTRELTSSNQPLRGGKGDMYEGGIRVPFLVQWKGTFPKGRIYRNPISSLDIFATSAAVAKAPLTANHTIDGVNLVPYISGNDNRRPHKQLYWRLRRKTALRLGDWKIVRNTRGSGLNKWELYNLSRDIEELEDLSDSHPEKISQLKIAWNELNSQMVHPIVD